MNVIGSNFKLSDDDENVIKVRERHGKTHHIEAVIGTQPILDRLSKGQSVCWGDGKTYHFRLTPKE
jgi:hypothetical protein